MSEKRELSDEALDLVAGGIRKEDGFGGIGTIISTSGSAAAGTGAGTGDSGLTIGGDPTSKHADRLCEEGMIIMQLRNAGTYELYLRDLDEYQRQHAEWRQKCELNRFVTTNGNVVSQGREPIRPNPYDYL